MLRIIRATHRSKWTEEFERVLAEESDSRLRQSGSILVSFRRLYATGPQTWLYALNGLKAKEILKKAVPKKNIREFSDARRSYVLLYRRL